MTSRRATQEIQLISAVLQGCIAEEESAINRDLNSAAMVAATYREWERSIAPLRMTESLADEWHEKGRVWTRPRQALWLRPSGERAVMVTFDWSIDDQAATNWIRLDAISRAGHAFDCERLILANRSNRGIQNHLLHLQCHKNRLQNIAAWTPGFEAQTPQGWCFPLVPLSSDLGPESVFLTSRFLRSLYALIMSEYGVAESLPRLRKAPGPVQFLDEVIGKDGSSI